MTVSLDIKGVVISDCEKYRYELWRIWDDNKPKVMFIMLNPSTADADANDPTIRRCIGYAKSWGYGGLYVGNLFGFRATNPKDLKRIANPIGDDNKIHLEHMQSKCKLIVCAWGNGQGKPERIFKKFDNLNYIELCKDGTPKHPLYLKKDLMPKSF